MSKRVLLSGYYGFENFGDELILSVLVSRLKGLGATPIVLSDNPEGTMRVYGVESIPRADIPAIWKAMRSADAFLSGGGGLFQDVTGPMSPLYYGGLIWMAKTAGLPVAFFGQGVGPLKTPVGRFLTSAALGQCRLVVVRDVKSQALLHQLTSRRGELMADTVWLWAENLAPTVVDGPKRMGVSLRPWPTLTDMAIRQLARCLADIPEVCDAGVNLIDCQAGTDIVPLSTLERELKARNIQCQWFSGERTAAGILQSGALIAMRYHALLVGSQIGIPIKTLSYDPKVQFLSAQLQLDDMPVDTLEQLDTDHLRQGFRPPDATAIEGFRTSAAHGFTLLAHWLQSITPR